MAGKLAGKSRLDTPLFDPYWGLLPNMDCPVTGPLTPDQVNQLLGQHRNIALWNTG